LFLFDAFTINICLLRLIIWLLLICGQVAVMVNSGPLTISI
jgi:hypothetical protein